MYQTDGMRVARLDGNQEKKDVCHASIRRLIFAGFNSFSLCSTKTRNLRATPTQLKAQMPNVLYTQTAYFPLYRYYYYIISLAY